MFLHGSEALDVLWREIVKAWIFLYPLVPNIVPDLLHLAERGCLLTSSDSCIFSYLLCLLTIIWIWTQFTYLLRSDQKVFYKFFHTFSRFAPLSKFNDVIYNVQFIKLSPIQSVCFLKDLDVQWMLSKYFIVCIHKW
jgi:hypothetical protein